MQDYVKLKDTYIWARAQVSQVRAQFSSHPYGYSVWYTVISVVVQQVV